MMSLASAMASAKSVDQDQIQLLDLNKIDNGSGDNELDADDEDLYDGSGYEDDSNFLDKIGNDEIEVKLVGEKTTTTSADIHFDDSKDNKDDEEDDDDILYEYYNEEYDSEEYNYDDDDDEYVEEDDLEKIKIPQQNEEDTVKVVVDDPISPTESGSEFFKVSYIYIMLASGILSFSIVLLLFFLCRRSAQERREKRRQMVQPYFVTSMTNPRYTDPKSMSSPIVKSYQRVPTSTKEFMAAPMEKPLLNN